ncbi:MAG: hypothetical protein V1838_00055 [Patescibacteria group bacterium]
MRTIIQSVLLVCVGITLAFCGWFGLAMQPEMQSEMKKIGEVCVAFCEENGYPPGGWASGRQTQYELIDNLPRESLLDPWGRSYVLKYDREGVTVLSYGPVGIKKKVGPYRDFRYTWRISPWDFKLDDMKIFVPWGDRIKVPSSLFSGDG